MGSLETPLQTLLRVYRGLLAPENVVSCAEDRHPGGPAGYPFELEWLQVFSNFSPSLHHYRRQKLTYYSCIYPEVGQGIVWCILL